MWPHGLTDKASDFESEDWGFESLCGRLFIKMKARKDQESALLNQYIAMTRGWVSKINCN